MRVNRDDIVRLNSASYKVVCQLIASHVEFSVSPSLVGIDHGQPLGRMFSLLRKKLMKGSFPSIVERFGRIGKNRLRRRGYERVLID